MNIADLFDEVGNLSPKRYGMSGAEFAAFLLCNPTRRFFIDIHMQWEWTPHGATPSYSFDVRLSCTQGHSNQVVDPYSTHHLLTFDEAMCLGWICHVTDALNTASIQQCGLLTNAKGSGRGGRDSIHFMCHNDSGQGYIRMAEGTTPPRHCKQAAYFVLTREFIKSQELFLTKNGVILFYGDVPQEFLRLSCPRWHAMTLDLEEDTCCRPQSLGNLAS